MGAKRIFENCLLLSYFNFFGDFFFLQAEKQMNLMIFFFALQAAII